MEEWCPIEFDPTPYENAPSDPSSDPEGSLGAPRSSPSPAGRARTRNIDRRPEPLHPESDSERQTGANPNA